MKEPIENREFIRERFEGRIEELDKMLNVITNGQLKDKSKSYYHKLEKFGIIKKDVRESIENNKEVK